MARFSLFSICLLYAVAFGQCSRVSKRSDDNGPLEAVISQLSQTVTTLNAKLQAAETLITTLQADLSSLRSGTDTRITNIQTDTDAKVANLKATKGSTYVRWGSTTCANGSQLLYSGTGGGSDIADNGSSSTRLCLSPEPVFDSTPVIGGGTATMTGLQYFLSGHLNTDVVCALCYTTLSTTFMVPGTNRCPAHSVLQYHGYLVAEQKKTRRAESICLETQPSDLPGSTGDQEPSGFLEHMVTNCSGSLACPPYQDNKVVTCAVCSM